MNREDLAGCKREDPELFFPISYTGAARQIEVAKGVCGRCPIASACLRYALDNPERASDGIWGGTTPRERRALRSAQPALEEAI
ncbi:WhiB family transcriptional regulator, redox-sensing transcriptional regulator [Streptosporangium canum]|uniref:Transcriptional regulator WhiB n=1 Tax=Streptosporangium canum TaxID=324952 RepID=A0A1I4DEA0_9ACTN|nr:WhiB family transcriptional regulator [Streptosporangium canum]SFK91978.1 WhiB family transcriptional regulator, redox-sensing transcriptional regulator [Streptosporangium canum]